MTEDEAHDWITTTFGERQHSQLEALATLVLEETTRQNLIAPSTLQHIWTRHVVDSAQLLRYAPDDDSLWVDVGTGAGFPGLVVATLRHSPIRLVEPRKKRAAFLTYAAECLELTSHAQVVCANVRSCTERAACISARAVAPLSELLQQTQHCATDRTTWILPTGRSAIVEVARAKTAWQGMFHVEHSITDPDAWIVIATKVQPR